MRNSAITFMLLLSMKSAAQQNSMYITKFTNINPVSYTDVIFTGHKDTVLVSTYSGRIAQIIRGSDKEKILAKINDEIYALAYNKKTKEIIASTFENGILIIDERNGKVVKKIPLHSSWSNVLVCSENFNYLIAYDQKGQRYVFDMANRYQKTEFDTLMPPGRIIKIDKDDIITISTSKKVTQWNLSKKTLVKEWYVELDKFGDMDNDGNFLSVNFNECTKYDGNNKLSSFKIMHPNWPLPNPESNTEIFEIPYQMQINAAKFAKSFIYTSSIDRSIRVWDKNTGKLITTLKGHKGSISKLKVTGNEAQVVSIDLKGVIKFWDVN